MQKLRQLSLAALRITILLLAVLAANGLSPASAQQTDSSQGLTWTIEHQTVFTGQADTSLNAAPGNTSPSADGAWVDESGNDWNTGGGLLLNPAPGGNGAGYGSGGWLDRPAGVTTLNQRIVVVGYAFASYFHSSVSLRINAAGHQTYTVGVGSGSVEGYYFNNFGAAGGTFAALSALNGSTTAPVPVGHYYCEDVSAVSSAGHTATTVALTYSDLGTTRPTGTGIPTGTVVFAATTSADAGAGVQAAGTLGLGTNQATSNTVSLTTYNNGVVTAPALQAGTASLASTAPGAATLETTAATGGTAPYSYALYRYSSPVFTPPGAGTLAGSRAGVAAGVAPAPITDTATTGLYFYKWTATDSAGTPATVVSLPVPAAIPDAYYSAGFLGDSRTRGGIGTALLRQYAVTPVLVSPGSGYTSAPPITVTNPPGFAGISAAYACSVSGGQVTAVWPTVRGWGYTTVGPTLRFTGGGGTGAQTFTPTTGSPQSGGGPALACEQLLSNWGGGIHQVHIYNGGVDGSQVSSFQPGSYNLLSALGQCGPPSQCPVIVLDWGVNDAGAGTAAAAYKASLLTLAQYLVSLGYVVAINYPYYRVPDYGGAGDSTNDLLLQYQQAIDQVIATDSAHIKPGARIPNAMFAASPGLLFAPDMLHPSDAGGFAEADQEAKVLAPLLGLSPLPSVQITAPSLALAPSASVQLSGSAVSLPVGVTDSALTWSITEGGAGGSVSTGGLYTAPATPGTYHVVAASHADPTKTATVAVTVAPLTPLAVTLTPGAASMGLSWAADPLAVHGYAVEWTPGGALPVAGQVKVVLAVVPAGTLTWTDTSAYRLTLVGGGRYSVTGLH